MAPIDQELINQFSIFALRRSIMSKSIESISIERKRNTKNIFGI